MSNSNTLSPSDQLNENMPQLPPEAFLPEDLGSDACPWLDRYVDFSRIGSPLSYDGYHEACGLFVLSTVAAGRVAYDLGGQRKSNLNLLLIGRTSIHAKSTASTIAKDLLIEADLDWLLAADETTPQKLIEDMSSNKLPANFNELDDREREIAIFKGLTVGQRGWIVDEFGGSIEAMHQANGVMAGLRGLIRTLDGAPKTYEYKTITRDQNLIRNPYLPILGNLTIADLVPFAQRGASIFTDGFLARFATPTPPPSFLGFGRFQNQQRIFPASLIYPLREWNNRLGFPEYETANLKKNHILKFEPMSPIRLVIAEDAFEAFYKYHNALRFYIWQKSNQDLDGNYGRFPEKAMRIAALFASFEKSDTIELRHWAKAQAITERWRVDLHHLYQQLVEQSGGQSARFIKNLPIEDQIVRAIGIKKMPDLREISQFTGLRKDLLEPAISKLASDNKIVRINDNGGVQFILPE
jgi:hypothetical protein